MNDYSIRRYSMGWEDVINQIESKYQIIKKDPSVQFNDELVFAAISVTEGKLKKSLISFAKELNFNLESLREKSKIGNHKSPFGTGA